MFNIAIPLFSERQKSVEQQEVFDELNKSLSVLDVHNKEMECQLNIIHNIKRLILLGDVKSAGDLMSSMKSDGCYMSEGKIRRKIIYSFAHKKGKSRKTVVTIT